MNTTLIIQGPNDRELLRVEVTPHDADKPPLRVPKVGDTVRVKFERYKVIEREFEYLENNWGSMTCYVTVFVEEI